MRNEKAKNQITNKEKNLNKNMKNKSTEVGMKENEREKQDEHILFLKVSKFLRCAQQVYCTVEVPAIKPHPWDITSFGAFLSLAKFQMILAIFQVYPKL